MLINDLNLTDDEKLFQKTLDSLSSVLKHPSYLPVNSKRFAQQGEILDRLAAKLEEQQNLLARLMVEQTHRPISACRMEIRRSIQTLEKTKAAALRACQPRGHDFSDALQGGHTAISQRFTFAPLFAITPFNFPLNLTLHKIAPAIALGLPFICKPPVQCLELFSLLNEWLIDCGVNAQSFALYFAPNELVSKALERLPAPLISFTGSRAVGLQLKQKFWDRRVILELGSTAAAVVCSDVPQWQLEQLSQDLARSAFGNSGQSCISLQHLLLEDDVCDDLISHLRQTASTIARYRDPNDENTLVGPLISRTAFNNALTLVNQALDCGAEVWSAGAHSPEDNYFAPTLVIYPNNKNKSLEQIRLTREEAFAPLVCIHRVPDQMAIEKCTDLIKRFDANIHASVYTYQSHRSRQLFETLPSRTVLWNDIPSWRADEMPYGGSYIEWAKGHFQHSGLLGDEGPYQTIMELTMERLFVLP
jgi:acyl-CoA reductase-like NAD-dependent aldehyde dehydrogenase